MLSNTNSVDWRSSSTARARGPADAGFWPDSDPIPFADYLGTIRVTPARPGACVVTMTASFVPVEIDEETARGISVGNITQALENARKAVSNRQKR